MRYFRIRDKSRQRAHQRQLDEKNLVIEKLKEQIDSLAIDNQAKQELNQHLEGLAVHEEEEQDQAADFPWLNSFLDSELFRGIQSSLSSYINSKDFKPVEISPEEMKMLEDTQRKLLGAIGADPEKIAELLKQAPENKLLPDTITERD